MRQSRNNVFAEGKTSLMRSITSFMAVAITSFCVRQGEMMLTYGQMMFATALQNDVVSCGHKHKK